MSFPSVFTCNSQDLWRIVKVCVVMFYYPMTNVKEVSYLYYLAELRSDICKDLLKYYMTI